MRNRTMGGGLTASGRLEGETMRTQEEVAAPLLPRLQWAGAVPGAAPSRRDQPPSWK